MPPLKYCDESASVVFWMLYTELFVTDVMFITPLVQLTSRGLEASPGVTVKLPKKLFTAEPWYIENKKTNKTNAEANNRFLESRIIPHQKRLPLILFIIITNLYSIAMCAKHLLDKKIDFRIFCVWLIAAAMLGSLLTYAYFAFILSSRGPFDVGEDQIRLVTDRDYYPAVTGLINSANASVRMMMYDMRFYFSYPKSSVNRVVEGMEAALGRGVDVKIITSRKATVRDVLVTIDARNMSIRYDANTTSGANFIIIDSKIVIIGSSHLEHYSFEANREANVIIYSEPLARRMEAYFEKAWVEYEQQK